ncbi:MAG: ThiF family adenylyltransferase [Candidatus Nanohalobium sp.]
MKHSRLQALENLTEQQIKQLQASKVAVIGLGATGGVIAESLARYGVNLKIFDRDYLEENDLYSSGLYTETECRKSLPKAEAAAEKLSEFTEVEKHVESLNAGNVNSLDEVDLVIDATDNMETRFLIDEYARKNGKAWVYTAALAETGYSMFFDEKCFSCVFEQVRPGKLGTCRTEGIVRDVAALAGHRSSLKAFKHLTGLEVSEKLDVVPSGESFDVEASGCEVCRGENFPHLGSEEKVSSVCGENKYQVNTELPEEAFEKLRAAGEVVADNEYILRAEVDGKEFALYHSGGALLEAEDRGHAEARFSEVVGI